MSVTTATATSPCAWKASYEMSKMTGPPQPMAGKKGTKIVVQDLFYTMPSRRKAFAKPRNEYDEIVHVVSCYALHYPAVSFVLKCTVRRR